MAEAAEKKPGQGDTETQRHGRSFWTASLCLCVSAPPSPRLSLCPRLPPRSRRAVHADLAAVPWPARGGRDRHLRPDRVGREGGAQHPVEDAHSRLVAFQPDRLER